MLATSRQQLEMHWRPVLIACLIYALLLEVKFFRVDVRCMVEDLEELDVVEDEVLIAGKDCVSHSWRPGKARASFAWG